MIGIKPAIMSRIGVLFDLPNLVLYPTDHDELSAWE